MPKRKAPEGSRRGLLWSAASLGAGILLNADRVPAWAAAAALFFGAWRLLAAVRPVPLPGAMARTLVALLLVAGILVRFHTLNGLAAGTALLLLMGSVKLLETRSGRDQLIVIGAGIFLLLAACLDRQSFIRAPLYLAQAWLCCTALAIVAYESGGTRGPVVFDNRAAMLLAGRSLAYALPLAFMLFMFFPRLPGAFWAIPRSDEALTGLGDTMSPGSISQLTTSYDVAFRAHFDGPPPPPQERYWRGPVLHEFDGYTWRRRNISFMRPQALEYLGAPYRYRISLEPSSQRWWFSLDTPTGSPSPKAFLTFDYQLVSAEPVTANTSYSLLSHTSTRAGEDLSPSLRRYDTTVTGQRNPRTRALAMKMRADTASDAAYVAAVLEYFRTGGFEYTLTPPRLAADSVDDFVFNTRLGFCGHYASAFVLFMRAAGIPARVVTGYLGGEWNPIGRYFIVRQSDAHAWGEVWLEGRGWTRVDPTGVVEPERLRRGILDLLPNAVSAPARFVWSQPWLAAALQRWDAVNTWWNDQVVGFNYEHQLRLLERLGVKAPGAAQLGWAFGIGLIVWMAWMAWYVGTRGRPARLDRVARAYVRLCRKLARAGVTREAHQGPLALLAKVENTRPDLTPELTPLLAQYVRLRYGRAAADSHDGQVREFERAVSRLAVRARA